MYIHKYIMHEKQHALLIHFIKQIGELFDKLQIYYLQILQIYII